MAHTWLMLLASATVGVGYLFTHGAWWKARHRSRFRAVLLAQGRRSALVLSLGPIVVPIAEGIVGLAMLVVGCGLVLEPSVVGLVGSATVVVSISFIGYLGWHLLRGERVPCGCMNDSEVIGVRSMMRPIFMGATGSGALLMTSDLAVHPNLPESLTRLGCGAVIAAVLSMRLARGRGRDHGTPTSAGTVGRGQGGLGAP